MNDQERINSSIKYGCVGFLSQTRYSALCIIHHTDESFYCLLSIFRPARISKSVRERKPHLSTVISFASFHVVKTGCCCPQSHQACMSMNQAAKKKTTTILKCFLYLLSENVFKSVIWECFKGVMESLSLFCSWKMKLHVAVKVIPYKKRVHISILYLCCKSAEEM